MGMFSAAIGAGAGAVASQAQGLIDSETKVNAEKELLAAREQMQMRLNEAQEQTRRSGNAYDFAQAGAQQPTVLERSAAASKQADTNAATSATANAAAERVRVNVEAAARKADPTYDANRQASLDVESTGAKQTREAKIKYESQMGEAALGRSKALNTRAAGSTTTEEARQKYMAIVEMELDPNLPPEERAALAEQKQGYLNIIQKGGGKGPAADSEKDTRGQIALLDKEAKDLEKRADDTGDKNAAVEAARKRAQSTALHKGISDRATAAGKGAAAPGPEAAKTYLIPSQAAKDHLKKDPSAKKKAWYDGAFGPGAADAILKTLGVTGSF